MILQRYILKQLLVIFLFTFSAIMAVSLMGTMFQVFRTIEGMGFEPFIRMAPLSAGYVAPWALLIASCTSTTLVYGRLTADNEIDAMRTSGIHTGRILAPAFLFGLLLSGFGYWLCEYATPEARFGRNKVVRQLVVAFLKSPPPGYQRLKIGLFQLAYIDYREGWMERIDLMQFDGGRLAAEYQAVRGRFEIEEGKPMRIVLDKPSITRYGKGGGVQRMVAGNEVGFELEIAAIIRSRKKPREMTQPELWQAYLDTGTSLQRAKILTIIHTRFSQALAPFLLVMMAVPIGIFVKRGSRLAGLGASLPPILTYFVLFFVCKAMGEKGRLDPALAAWLPDAALAFLALILLRSASRR